MAGTPSKPIKGPDGTMISVKETARLLKVGVSTIYRRFNELDWKWDEFFTREPEVRGSSDKKRKYSKSRHGFEGETADGYSLEEELRQRALRVQQGLSPDV